MKSIVFAALAVVCLASSAIAQDVPRYEVSAGATFLRDPSNLNRWGWVSSAGTNINKYFGVKAEVAGYYSSASYANVHSFLTGPQFNLRRNDSKVTPWAHFLMGAQVINDFPFPGVAFTATRFAVQPGGGFDVSLNPRISFRFGADWLRGFQRFRDESQYRLQSGVVFKLR